MPTLIAGVTWNPGEQKNARLGKARERSYSFKRGALNRVLQPNEGSCQLNDLIQHLRPMKVTMMRL